EDKAQQDARWLGCWQRVHLGEYYLATTELTPAPPPRAAAQTRPDAPERSTPTQPSTARGCAPAPRETPLHPASLLLGLENRPPKARPTSDDSRGGAGDDDGDSGGSGRSVDSRNSRDSLDKRRNSGSSAHRKDSICRSHRQSFR